MMDNIDDLLHRLAQEAEITEDSIEYMECEGDTEAIRYYCGKLEGLERALHIVQTSLV